MDDLISRQAVKDWLLKWEGYIDKDTITRMQYRVIDIRPAEVEPVRRGRWVEESGMFMCSVCHDVWSTENEEMIKGFNYCPWCGAKMEEEE